MPRFIVDLLHNPCVWSSFLAWTTAQFAKMLCGYTRTRRMDFSYIVSIGGMPSAHAAMAWGLATSVGMTVGLDTPAFAISLAFASVIIFDASTVRRAAGQQARLLNDIIDEVFRERHFSDRKLKELLGHTRLEVFMGTIVGILVGMIVTSLWTIVLTSVPPRAC